MTFECGKGKARITWSMFACACEGAAVDAAFDSRQPGRSRGRTSASVPSRVVVIVDPGQRGLRATRRATAHRATAVPVAADRRWGFSSIRRVLRAGSAGKFTGPRNPHHHAAGLRTHVEAESPGDAG